LNISNDIITRVVKHSKSVDKEYLVFAIIDDNGDAEYIDTLVGAGRSVKGEGIQQSNLQIHNHPFKTRGEDFVAVIQKTNVLDHIKSFFLNETDAKTMPSPGDVINWSIEGHPWDPKVYGISSTIDKKTHLRLFDFSKLSDKQRIQAGVAAVEYSNLQEKYDSAKHLSIDLKIQYGFLHDKRMQPLLKHSELIIIE